MFTRLADAEFEQSIIRLLLGSIVIAYLLIFAPFQSWMIPSFTGFILISLAFTFHIYKIPGTFYWRRISGQIVDLGAISINLYLCGQVAVAVFGVYLWVIVGNGCRFGVRYLLSAIVIATFFFSIVAFNEPFWVEHKTLAIGIGVTLLIVPVYFAVLLHRLNLANKRLELLSLYDELTGLMNRRAFDSQIASEVSRLKRFPASFSLALIDIDHFKKVNDQYGHLSGDVVLQKIAQILKQTCRDVDIVSRFGGEEFALLLPGYERGKKDFMGERLRKIVEQATISTNDHSIRVTISVGIAYWDDQYESCKDWIRAADDALYRAKHQGRNKVVVDDC